MISFIISSNSFSTSWQIFESIKDLEIKNSMLLNLHFANKTILSYVFFYFLIIDLYVLIFAAIAQLFNPTTELAIPIRKPNKEAKAGIEIHPLIAETEIRKCSI